MYSAMINVISLQENGDIDAEVFDLTTECKLQKLRTYFNEKKIYFLYFGGRSSKNSVNGLKWASKWKPTVISRQENNKYVLSTHSLHGPSDIDEIEFKISEKGMLLSAPTYSFAPKDLKKIHSKVTHYDSLMGPDGHKFFIPPGTDNDYINSNGIILVSGMGAVIVDNNDNSKVKRWFSSCEKLAVTELSTFILQ